MNSACPAQLKERLRHFGSRRAMDIEHLGESTLDQLVDRKRVKDFADLYTLTAGGGAQARRFAEEAAPNPRAALAPPEDPGPPRLLHPPRTRRLRGAGA